MTGLLRVRTEAEGCKYVTQSRAFCKHGGTGALKSRQAYAEVSQTSSLRAQQCTVSKHDTRTCSLICLQKPSPSPSEEKGQKGPGRDRKCLQAGGKLGDGAREAEQPWPFPSTKAVLSHPICRRQKPSKLTRPSYPLPPGPALTEPAPALLLALLLPPGKPLWAPLPTYPVLTFLMPTLSSTPTQSDVFLLLESRNSSAAWLDQQLCTSIQRNTALTNRRHSVKALLGE